MYSHELLSVNFLQGGGGEDREREDRGEGDRERRFWLPGVSSYLGTSPIMRDLPSPNPIYLLKDPSSHNITVKLRASVYEFREGKVGYGHRHSAHSKCPTHIKDSIHICGMKEHSY